MAHRGAWGEGGPWGSSKGRGAYITFHPEGLSKEVFPAASQCIPEVWEIYIVHVDI